MGGCGFRSNGDNGISDGYGATSHHLQKLVLDTHITVTLLTIMIMVLESNGHGVRE
jgi:hypothetical protein